MSVVDDIVQSAILVAEATGDIGRSTAVRLKDYVEVEKNLKLDVWQIDLCDRLEKAFWLAQAGKFYFVKIDFGIGRPYVVAPSGLKIDLEEFEAGANKGCRVAIHAPPQVGKSCIISHCYPAWILGYDPIHRFRLATFNITRSVRFSGVVRRILLSPEHKAFFPNPEGWVDKRAAAAEWSTEARLKVNDGQSSFMALGLQTGFVGTGADTLIEDDVYASAEDALSEVIRDKTWRFHTETAEPRLSETSNAFIMFHRYHHDDQSGRALGDPDLNFQLWLYAAQEDGDYIVDQTGLPFACLPIGRPAGGYLTLRKDFPVSFWERKKKNAAVWQAQFQGQPTAKTGNFFDISKITVEDWSQELVDSIVHWVRPWDNAATDNDGDFTAGPLMGIRADEHIFVFDMVHEQVNTAGRHRLQSDTADKDGPLVAITHPKDPGSAGVDVAFDFSQAMMKKGFIVEIVPTTGDKTQRASPYSRAVNEGRVHFVRGRNEASEWNIKDCINVEMRYFPNSKHKDRVDAMADGYKYLDRLFHRGLVIKSFTQSNVVPWALFAEKFGNEIPGTWECSAAIRLAPDSSKPSGWALLARAAQEANLGEAVFIVDAERMFVDGLEPLLLGLLKSMDLYLARGRKQVRTTWVKSDGADVVTLAAEKHQVQLARSEDEADAGLAETNWYFQSLPKPWPFGDVPGRSAARAYIFADVVAAIQDARTWPYSDRGKPQTYGGITVDCARMCLLNFALRATALTLDQKREARLPDHLKPEALRAALGTEKFPELYSDADHAMNQIIKAEETEKQKQGNGFLGRKAAVRRFRTR